MEDGRLDCPQGEAPFLLGDGNRTCRKCSHEPSIHEPLGHLYAGEQDMFYFLIDPCTWVEIKGEAFAPADMSLTHFPREEVRKVLAFWKVDLL
jgi:hypothetical protein